MKWLYRMQELSVPETMDYKRRARLHFLTVYGSPRFIIGFLDIITLRIVVATKKLAEKSMLEFQFPN